MTAHKPTTWIIVISLAFSGWFSIPAKAAGPANSNNKALPLQELYITTVKVVNIKVNSTVVAKARAVSEPASCSVSLNVSFLQGSNAPNLFTKPASCFSIIPLKEQAEAKPLTVLNEPEILPQIIVYNFPQSIENEIQLPLLPLARPFTPLPVPSVLLAFATSPLILLGRFEKLQNQNRKFRILSPEQLQIMRC